MDISRPPLPLPSQTRRNNFVQKPTQQPVNERRSRSKSRQGSKQGVTLARDYSIRFDKQYQQKHMVIKTGIRLDSSKKTLNTKQPEQTTIYDKSTYVGNSKTFNSLEDTILSPNRPMANTTYVAYSKQGQNDDIKSMTSLDLNHPMQLERMKGK